MNWCTVASKSNLGCAYFCRISFFSLNSVTLRLCTDRSDVAFYMRCYIDKFADFSAAGNKLIRVLLSQQWSCATVCQLLLNWSYCRIFLCCVSELLNCSYEWRSMLSVCAFSVVGLLMIFHSGRKYACLVAVSHFNFFCCPDLISGKKTKKYCLYWLFLVVLINLNTENPTVTENSQFWVVFGILCYRILNSS